jgi:cellulose synthase/poly-beta-1,6-N-acetylglucosamine synthase-like glycosyltransferase
MTKRKKDSQYNDQKKKGHYIACPFSFGHYIACPFIFWSLYCLSFFLLVIILPVLFSFGHYLACPFFFCSLYCLSFFLFVFILNDERKRTGTIMPKRKKDRQYNDQKERE